VFTFFQAHRQKQREEADDVRHQLDQELDTIRGLLSCRDPLSESLEKKLAPQPFDAAGEDRDQQYDQFVRELVFDQRSKPKDRTKTEEELALEAKIALEKAERQRIKRMNGEDAESSEEDGRPGKRRRFIGADDLEDDFNNGADEWDGLGRGLISSLDNASEEGSSVDDGNKEDSSASNDETGADHHSEPPWYGLADSGDSKSLSAERKEPRSTSPSELPYTFSCPSSHEEFLDIVEGIADQDVPTVVERIRALHHPSLGAENASKLQVSSNDGVAFV
jgi:nucleolar protein 14